MELGDGTRPKFRKTGGKSTIVNEKRGKSIRPLPVGMGTNKLRKYQLLRYRTGKTRQRGSSYETPIDWGEKGEKKGGNKRRGPACRVQQNYYRGEKKKGSQGILEQEGKN